MGSENDVRAPAPSSASTVNGNRHTDPASEQVTGPTLGPDRSHANSQSVRPTTEGLPIWMQRTFLVIFVILCIETGIVLIAVPWQPVWSNNALLGDYPQIRNFVRLGFVRGIVTGIGLLDIWIGIWEAVHYRERKPA